MENIDYEAKLSQLETERQDRLTETEQMYGEMIDASQERFQGLINESKQWAAAQQAAQQAQTDFAIEKIEQEKEQTRKDYTKEQSGAYADWQKESNRYGVNAETLATGGLTNTGYGESSQVRLYNTYQNRVAVARETYNLAILNYNNAIREAQIQNSSALAAIAHSALQEQLQFALQSMEYENQLMMGMEGQLTQIEDSYYGRYLDVLNQMNAENALAEQARQYDQNYELKLKEYEEGVRQFDEEMARLKALDAEEKNQWDLMYANSQNANTGILKDSLTTESKTSGFTGKFLPTVGSTANNKDISELLEKIMPNASAGSYSAAGYQQKLANDEKKLQGVGSGVASASIAGIGAPGIKAGAMLGSAIGDYYGAKNAYAVATDYYRGDLNPDAKTYGTFANGYQPKGIEGHGTLEKTGDQYEFDTTKQYGTKSGKTVTVRQNIWKAEDGTLWYWEGKDNEYKPMPKE